jgi:hypothetical protein
MGHDRYHGLFMLCVHTCVSVYSVCMCAFAYIWTDSLQICWEHITTHHKWHGLLTFHVHAPSLRVRART